MNEFGNYLYALRREKGMTQQELADILGVTNKAISNWETGETFPETKQLVPLANIFGVSVDELLRGKTDASRQTESPEPPAQEKREQIIEKYLPESWRKTFALLISVGVGLILAGVAVMVAFAFAFENRELMQCIGVCIMLGMIIAGADFCIVAGVWQDSAFLPVQDGKWKRNLRKFTARVVSGVSLIMLAVICFVLSGALQGNNVLTPLLIVLGFVILAGAIFLIVYGGISWDGYRKQVMSATDDAEIKRAISDEHGGHPKSVADKLCGALMLLATVIFLLLGFIWNLWHPGWLVFPIGGIGCAIINIFARKN